jgi:predicted PurR-regulated permease PerM
MNQSTRISYVIMAALLVLSGWLHLGTLVLTSLFGFFALQILCFGRSRYLGVTIYAVAVVVIGSALFYFSRQAYLTLPEIAEKTIPAVTEYAERQGIELPFTDYASLKSLAISEVKQDVAGAGRHAREAAFKFVQLLIGLFIAASLFLNANWGSETEPGAARDSVYSSVARELSLRFETFFRSFSRVIGAQIIISTINTALTGGFLLWNHYPYIAVITMLTFLCGLVPIVGNVMSNTLIVFVGFTISPRMALAALIFLMVIHKLEYFLNSKIVGDRIKNPMWLTLIGLVLGEKLMGVPGMILAPVVLHYIKVEASKNKMAAGESAPHAGPPGI